MKKFFALLVALITALSLTVPCFAETVDATSSTTVTTIDLGNGYSVERVIVEYTSLTRASTKRGYVTDTYKNNDTVIGTVTLNATFSYNGTSASVISTSSSHTTEGAWIYKNETVWDSGNTAYLTADLFHLLFGTVGVDMSLSCSPTGVLS